MTNKGNKRSANSDYQVGYRNPPKGHQFQKGKSGNPKGRPRKRQAEQVDVGATLSRSVPVRTKTGKIFVHPFEATLKSLVRRALEENHLTSVLEALKIFETYGEFVAPVVVSGGGVITAPPGVNFHEWFYEVTELVADVDDAAENIDTSSDTST